MVDMETVQVNFCFDALVVPARQSRPRSRRFRHAVTMPIPIVPSPRLVASWMAVSPEAHADPEIRVWHALGEFWKVYETTRGDGVAIAPHKTEFQVICEHPNPTRNPLLHWVPDVAFPGLGDSWRSLPRWSEFGGRAVSSPVQEIESLIARNAGRFAFSSGVVLRRCGPPVYHLAETAQGEIVVSPDVLDEDSAVLQVTPDLLDPALSLLRRRGGGQDTTTYRRDMTLYDRAKIEPLAHAGSAILPDALNGIRAEVERIEGEKKLMFAPCPGAVCAW